MSDAEFFKPFISIYDMREAQYRSAVRLPLFIAAFEDGRIGTDSMDVDSFTRYRFNLLTFLGD